MWPKFIWSIERFKTLPLIPDKWLRSPIFYADSSKIAKFCLGFRGVEFPSNSNGHVASLFFCRCDTDGPENVEVEYTISLNQRRSRYKQRFPKPQQGAYQSYETDGLAVTTSDFLKTEITVVCMILSYDDDKYASSGVIDRTDFDDLSYDLSQMFIKPEFSDAVIRIQNHEFNVHKAILDVRCPELLRECQVKNRQNITPKGYNDCTRMLLRYVYSGLFLSRDIPDDLYLLLKKCNDSIFEHLFPTFPIELHIRTSFEKYAVFTKWDIEKFLEKRRNREYRYKITRGQPSTWFTIIFLEGETEYIEFVIHKMCKKTIAFVQCEITILEESNLEDDDDDRNVIFKGNHLFIDEHPWEVQLDHGLRTTRKKLQAKPKYFSLVMFVTDGKPTNSVRKTRFSSISGSHRHSVENVFQLSRDMGKLYKNPMHSDVTLIIKDKRIPAHKAILSARSARFHEILQQNTIQTEIPINDLDEKVALSMIHYIYSAHVLDMDIDHAFEVHKAADLYNMKRLKRKCTRYLELSLTAENIGEILLFADTQNDCKLKNFVYRFITTHPTDVLKSKQSMGIMRSFHYLHLDVYRLLLAHLAEKV